MLINKRTTIRVLAILFSVALLLSGCIPVKTTQTTVFVGTKDEQTAVINILREPQDLCSLTTLDTLSFSVLHHLVDGLTILDQDDKPIPGVAKDWTISDDGLVYTFHLRDDYTWSSGEKVTAKDFEFAFKSLLNPQLRTPYSCFGLLFKNAVASAQGKSSIDQVGIKAINDNTLELTLEQPVPYLLNLLAHGAFLPVNQKAFEAFGNEYGTAFDKIVTNGAYTLSSWEHESEVVLVKNTDYPKADDINIEKIVMKMISDYPLAMKDFQSNKLDMIDLSPQQAKILQADGKTVESYADGSVGYIEYNTSNHLLANKKLRKALTYSIDRDGFTKTVLKDNSIPATNFTPPTINGLQNSSSSYIYDVEMAKTFLQEAMQELETTTLSLSILIDESNFSTDQALFLQNTWSNLLGVTITIEIVPFEDKIKRAELHDFDIILSNHKADFNDPIAYLSIFENHNANNYADYDNAEYNTLVRKISEQQNNKTRVEDLTKLETLLAEDMPVVPCFYKVNNYITSEKLSGVVRTAFQEFNLRWAKVKQPTK